MISLIKFFSPEKEHNTTKITKQENGRKWKKDLFIFLVV